MDKSDCPRLHHGLRTRHKCHKSRGARMVPADELLGRPCKRSIDPALDLLLVRGVRLWSPEVEYQEQVLPPELEMLLNHWLAADVMIASLHVAATATGSLSLSCSSLNLSVTLIAAER